MQWILRRERLSSLQPESVSRFSREAIDRVTYIAAVASVDGYLVATMAVVHAEERQALVGLGGLGGLADCTRSTQEKTQRLKLQSHTDAFTGCKWLHGLR